MTPRGLRRATFAVAASLAGGAPACADPPLTSCADSLSGVWVADDIAPGGERVTFHILDDGGGRGTGRVTIYPMYDASVPPGGDKRDIIYAPPVFTIDRIGGRRLGGRPGRPGRALVGTRSQRVTRRGVVCNIRRQAAIRDCAGDSLTLAWVPFETVDWDTCQARSPPGFTRLVLHRPPP